MHDTTLFVKPYGGFSDEVSEGRVGEPCAFFGRLA
jgi:hypothetical protein